MPKLGDKKPCILEQCDGKMEWIRIRPADAHFVNDDARHIPEPIPDFEAWECETCGVQQGQSND